MTSIDTRAAAGPGSPKDTVASNSKCQALRTGASTTFTSLAPARLWGRLARLRGWTRPNFVARNNLWVLPFIFATPFVGAAAPASSRSLPELIQLTLAVGVDETLHPPQTTNLGYSGDISGKMLSYDETVASDKKGHDLIVVSRNGKPTELVWGITGMDGQIIEGMSFRSTIKGKLLTALRAEGPAGHVVQTRMKVKDAKSAFDALKRFFLEDAVRLNPTP